MPHLWEVFILKNVVLLDQIKVLPLLAGIIMGITQFIPEMTKKRFKLTLHLPLGENRIVCLMLGYGMVCLLAPLRGQLRRIPVGTIRQLPA